MMEYHTTECADIYKQVLELGNFARKRAIQEAKANPHLTDISKLRKLDAAMDDLRKLMKGEHGA